MKLKEIPHRRKGKNYMYTSDWHIHCEASYDADLTLPELFASAALQGITDFGISDHVNQPSWISYLRRARTLFDSNPHPGFHLGVELTTISGFLHDYDRLHGRSEAYCRPETTQDDPVALSLNAEELSDCGVEYTVGAAHWVLTPSCNLDAVLRDHHRQLLYLASDPRVDIVGHPFWIPGQFCLTDGTMGPFDDFSLVPRSMWDEFAAALLENHKYVEYNVLSFAVDDYPTTFRYAYAAFIRYLFERGVPVTIGTDEHSNGYGDYRSTAAPYLTAAGFHAEDFSIPRFRTKISG